MKSIIAILFCFILPSCVFDSGSDKIIGEYSVGWIDSTCRRTIYYGPIGQMVGQVVAIGWNSDFIIVKRHLECKKDKTDYFIIDIKKDIKRGKKSNGTKDVTCLYDCGFGRFGPYDENEFLVKRNNLAVPEELVFTNHY